MSEIQYTYKYKLQLDCRGFQNASSVVLQNDKSTTAIYNNISMVMSLYGVTFHRKVYEPGNIQAEILIQTSDSDLPTVDLLTTMLVRRPVSLLVEKSHYAGGTKTVDATYTVAEKYYIHEISPQFERRKTRIEVLDGEGNPQGETVAVNWIYIKLDIYSPDKLLTLSKYSQAHFGETLFGDILTNNIDSFQLRFKSTAANTITNTEPIEVDTRHLSHLGYTEGTSTTQKELIQPYLVQYNESFYDFLRRTANRCGEVFYFEDGKFCVGTPESENTTPVSDNSRIIFQRVSEGALSIRDYARDALKEWYADRKTYEPKDGDVITDPVRQKLEKPKFGATDDDEDKRKAANFPKLFPADAFPKVDEAGKVFSHPYNSEVASEDHYMMLFKNKFAHDSVNDLWCGDDAEHTMRTVSLLLNSTSLMELLTNFSLKEMESAAKAQSKAKKTTSKGNAKIDDKSEDPDKKYLVFPYKIDNDKDNHWITLNYVKDIRDHEEAQMRGMVCVDMGTGFQSVKLGDKITLPKPNQSKTYVVVQIEMTSGKAWQRDYDGFVEGEASRRGEPSQRFYAIPMVEKTDGTTTTHVFYPPLLSGEPFRRCGAQPAFVFDSKDPVGQGRVRIRYPWQPFHEKSYDDIDVEKNKTAVTTARGEMDAACQDLSAYATDIVISEEETPKATMKAGVDKKKFQEAYNSLFEKYNNYITALRKSAADQMKHVVTEAASPWIRVATPMATPGGGVFFRPENGDEVMVNYENGNVERPYVTGALYSKNVPAPKEGGRVIVSKNGHTIKMTDPDNSTELLASLLPTLKLFSMYGVEIPGLNDVATRAMGGIELTDQLGFYNIKMSSHDRLISISSPFGNVNINALTGISIEAPNGDITITGKNIDISAYNKLTLTSGKNIKLANDKDRVGYFTTGANAGDAGKHIGKTIPKLFGIGKLIDFSLIRTLLEVFIRPIDGTLSLKSYRFLTQEAGDGSISINPALYDSHRTDTYRQCRDVKALEVMVLYIRDTVDGYINTYEELFNKVQSDYQAVKLRYAAAGGSQITTPGSGLDLLKTLFHDINIDHDSEGLKADEETFVTTLASFAIAPGVAFNTLQEAIKDEVKALYESIYALKKHVTGFLNMFNDIDKKGLWNAHSEAKISKVGAWEQAKSFARLRKIDISLQAGNVLAMTNPTISVAEENNIAAQVSAIQPQAGIPAAVVVPSPTPALVHASVDVGAGNFSSAILAVGKFIDSSATDDTLFNAPVYGDNFSVWKKYICRRLACVLIEKCRTNSPFATFTIAPAEYKALVDPIALTYTRTEPINMAFPFTDADWPRYVNDIKIAVGGDASATPTSGEKFVTGMFESLTEAAKKIFPGESLVWKHEATGQILLSDQKGKTFHFKDNGQTDFYDNLTKSLVDDVPSLLNTLRTFV